MEIKSYKKKNGTTAYGFRVYVGKENGKDKYIKRQGFPTKGKARSALLQLQEELEHASESKKDITVEEISKKWLKEYYETVQESTYLKTERMMKNHILPAIGSEKVTDITPLQMQEHLNSWMKKLVHGRKLKGLASNIFKYAIRYGYLDRNPMDSVITPAKKRTEDDIDFYDKEELKTFLSYVEKTQDIEKIALFRLLAFTGMRKGELLALQWEDLIEDTIQIKKAITRGFGGEEIGLTKTASSNRLVSIDKQTKEILLKLKKQFPHTKFMFESENGSHLSSSLPRKWLLQILKGTPLRPITIHQFRHTHASLCFEAGMTLKQVQYRLGHSDLKTTMNIYTHITKQAKDDIGEKFSNYIDF
ncbi:integrase [Streptococcus phage Javan290]|uniref:tyrosine-type recombinase/integrase n=1 Tax=Streptococcus marmotae TaxID=1825069 RepID=UPI00082F13CA|nr:site-specific integrase [Streptococcus marmotae]QBX26118.1 integrase [Streptococcus phage Javan290]